MNALANSKSLLAKLLATENLTVQHQNVPTASFDVKNRVLTLPILKEGLSVNLYDLMTSHEVGHALWTPEDGWHGAVSNKGGVFKGFLNIIEDARIEKNIKKKYPGLLKAYRDGYKELLDRDFFGIKGKDITAMSFIDRINLHFKLGTLVNLKFEGEEAVWVEKIANAETWEEVLDIANSLYAEQIEQAEQEQMMPASASASEESDEEDDGEDTASDEYSDEEDEGEDAASDGNGSESSDDSMDDDSTTSGSDSSDDSDDMDFDDYDGDSDDWDAEEEVEPTPEEQIESQTDKAFRSAEGSLVKNSGRTNKYYTYGSIKSDEFVIPFEKVAGAYDEMFAQSGGYIQREVEEKFKVWKNANSAIVNYMVKEFEMKKKADEFKRATVAKSGELDMKKIFSYKYNDDLFKRVTTIKGGKNHGFVMLIDWSGSMATNLAATIDQLMNLTMFCKKVKIPFEVYAFSDAWYDRGVERKYFDYQNLPMGQLVPGREGKLLTLVNSTMSLNDYNKAMLGLSAIKECMVRGNGRYYGFNIPSRLQLGGTPLDDALLVMPDVIAKFQAKTRVQITNLVILTDGDSHNCHYVTESGYDGETKTAYGVYSGYNEDAFITDTVTKKTVAVTERKFTNALLEIVSSRTGVNLIGFYIMDNKPRDIRNVCSRYGIYDVEVVKKIRETKFIEVNNAGFDSYFLLPGGSDMMTTSSGLDVSSDASKRVVASAFMKSSKGKTANRVLLSRLMEVVA